MNEYHLLIERQRLAEDGSSPTERNHGLRFFDLRDVATLQTAREAPRSIT